MKPRGGRHSTPQASRTNGAWTWRGVIAYYDIWGPACWAV